MILINEHSRHSLYFQNVKEMYALAEQIIAGDGKKSKLLKQIKQLKKALNITVIKGAQ